MRTACDAQAQRVCPHARTRRIDPVDAAIDAHFARMHAPGPAVVVASGVDELLSALGYNKE